MEFHGSILIIPTGFGPNCTDRGGPLYPGDQINIVIANDYLKNRPLSVSYTVMSVTYILHVNSKTTLAVLADLVQPCDFKTPGDI